MVTVSILGTGNRGSMVYGKHIASLPSQFKIVSLCDINEKKLQLSAKLFNVEEKNLFNNEDEFFKEKRSDVLVIATLDEDHVRQAKKAIKLGYHLLLEKPISASEKECLDLLECAKNYDKVIMVCHVLRYTVAVEKLKELLDSKIIGKLVLIDHIEQVAYWHQAHSYVRGNWRVSEDTAPMIMAKSCHDMDLLQYFAESKCKSLSSYGNLEMFRKENMPKDASERCLECKYKDTCPFSAKRIYLDEYLKDKQNFRWCIRILCMGEEVTEERIIEALNTTNYGKCVYDCDNNVVDNQSVMMEFENGVKATFRMTGLTQYPGRQIHFHGTLGEIYYNETEQYIKVNVFGEEEKVIKITDLTNDLSGHGGGDLRMVKKLHDIITNKTTKNDTSLADSIESHLMCISAEESRLNGGKTVLVHKK